METNETEYRTNYEIVYSKDRKNVISRSEWLYQKDWKDYEAAAIIPKEFVIDHHLWVSAALDNHEDLAINLIQSPDRWVFRSNGASDFGQTVPLKRSYNYIKKFGLFLLQYSFSQ